MATKKKEPAKKKPAAKKAVPAKKAIVAKKIAIASAKKAAPAKHAVAAKKRVPAKKLAPTKKPGTRRPRSYSKEPPSVGWASLELICNEQGEPGVRVNGMVVTFPQLLARLAEVKGHIRIELRPGALGTTEQQCEFDRLVKALTQFLACNREFLESFMRCETACSS